MKNKKGQEEGGGFSTTIGLVILLIATFILILFVREQMALGSNIEDTALCYTSILGSSLSSQETRARCPIKDYKVLNDKILENKEGKYEKSDIVKEFSASDDKVNELFAKLMVKCMQNGGGVNSRAFSRSWLTSSTVCLECSNVEFDKGISVSIFFGLREYLEKNNAQGTDKKYIDFLTKSEEHKEDWITNGKNELLPGYYGNVIKNNEIYTIFFIGIKEGSTSALFSGRLIGREDTYFVYASAQDRFNKMCDRKVN